VLGPFAVSALARAITKLHGKPNEQSREFRSWELPDRVVQLSWHLYTRDTDRDHYEVALHVFRPST